MSPVLRILRIQLFGLLCGFQWFTWPGTGQKVCGAVVFKHILVFCLPQADPQNYNFIFFIGFLEWCIVSYLPTNYAFELLCVKEY